MGVDIVEKEFLARAGLPLNKKAGQSGYILVLLTAPPIKHAVANRFHNSLDLVYQRADIFAFSDNVAEVIRRNFGVPVLNILSELKELLFKGFNLLEIIYFLADKTGNNLQDSLMFLGKEMFSKTVLVDHTKNTATVNDGDGQLGLDLS